MITFKEFLAEVILQHAKYKNVGNVDNYDKFIAALKKHCGDSLSLFLETGKGYFRGTGLAGNKFPDATFVDTKNSNRLSRDTHNLYQLVIDASGHFKGLPSRTNSLIMTSSMQDAKTMYSGSSSMLYQVFPYDGTVIAQADGQDFIYKAFEIRLLTVTLTLEQLDSKLMDVFKLLGIEHQVHRLEKQYSTLANKFNNVDLLDAEFAKISLAKLVEAFTLVFDLPFKNQDDLTELFSKDEERRFSNLAVKLAENVKIEKLTTADAPGYSRECWFNGKAIMVLVTSQLWEHLSQLVKKDRPEE
jgi:hypothetical protein